MPDAAPEPPAAPATVLVIDDEAAAREQVSEALAPSSKVQVVAEASNGMRGAELAEQLQPDVILLDLTMPVMDGYEALPLLRRVAPRAAILVRSNQGASVAASQVMRLGARRYLPKFMHPDDLRRTVEHAALREVPESLRAAIAGRTRASARPASVCRTPGAAARPGASAFRGV